MAHLPRASLRGTTVTCCLGLLLAAGPAAGGAPPAPRGPTPVTTAPTVAARGGWARLNWAQLRTDAWLVQNTQGNAYALQLGYTPQLRLRDVPLGLRLLAEFGALRDAGGRVFVAPSAQVLLTWQAVQHVELGLGAGVQVWCVEGGLVQPVVTAEAHYLPHRRVAKVLHAVFVSASAGASGGAGLQVRLGLALDFQRPTPIAPQHDATSLASAAAVAAGLQPTAPQLHLGGETPDCPACPACPPAAVQTSADVPSPPEDVLLAGRLTFAFNAAALSDEALAYLRGLGAALAAEPNAWRDLEVVGHADSVGTAPHTQLVSERRARAVCSALVEAGVGPERLAGRGVGETQPIAGEPPTAAAQRRVTLRLRGLGTSARLHAFVHAASHPYREPTQ